MKKDQLGWLSKDPDNDGLWTDLHDVLVIGSGYGGAIMASRLASAKLDETTAKRLDRDSLKVALVERGRETHPGEYPTTEAGAARHLQMTPSHLRLLGDRRNLYWLHVGEGMSVFSGCGLGGTSLVNANVSLRPEDLVFADSHWPEPIRTNVAGLDPYFDHAREVLEPTPYPVSYPGLDKDKALNQASGGTGITQVPINVRFQSGKNSVGLEQHACTCCGDCVTGCNAWAKNTLLMNYLPDAVEKGAKIFTEIDVDRIEKRDDDTWCVWARDLSHPLWREHKPRPITAKTVVVAAGTMGSIGILLRSKKAGLAISEQLGQHFTGNGDVLGFTTQANCAVNGVGDGHDSWDKAHLPGPTITAAIDKYTGQPLGDGIIIENAVIPGALARIVPPILAGESFDKWERRIRRLRHPRLGLFVNRLTGFLRPDGDRPEGLEYTATYLVMGHDDDRGAVQLNDSGDAVVNWPNAGVSDYYRRANKELKEAADNLEGTYLRDPISLKELGHNLITVHPLGGCVMADDITGGVVDHAGRVFDLEAPDARDVHEGLYVCDGSIVPRPLGVNPLLTISALAERCAALMAQEPTRGWTIQYPPSLADPPLANPTIPDQTPALRFTETLVGRWSAVTTPPQDVGAFTSAANAMGAQPIRYTINITAADVRKVIKDPKTVMQVPSGTVHAAGLGSGSFTVENGHFVLLQPVKDTDDSHMIYALPLTDDATRARYFLFGYKVIQPGVVGDVWHDTTTLNVALHENDQNGPVVGAGVMDVTPEHVLDLVRSMRIDGPVGQVERLELLAKFGKMFAGRMFHDYGHVIHRSYGLNTNAPPRVHRPLDLPAAEVHWFYTCDPLGRNPQQKHLDKRHRKETNCARLRLTRYNRRDIVPGPRGSDTPQPNPEPSSSKPPIVLSHGMGANPLTFSLDTIEPNLVEYLVNRGYDVWLQEWRGSTLLDSAQTETFTGDIVAGIDHPATAAVIKEITGRSDQHWITHCVGTMTVLMSILGGHLEPTSLLCSSAGAHPVASPVISFKTHLHLAEILRAVGIKRLTTTSTTDESVWERLFDLAVRINWVPKDERCDQAVCHRLEFIYGVAAHHAAIDEVTHYSLHELFGVTNLKMMSHLSECSRQQSLVNADGKNVYMPNFDVLGQFPITFIHGRHNLVWLPQSSADTYEKLVERFPMKKASYFRKVLSNHGHQDLIMGASSPQDAFPVILEHLQKWVPAAPAPPNVPTPPVPPTPPTPPGPPSPTLRTTTPPVR